MAHATIEIAGDEPTLIHPNGALDRDAIAAELTRRMVGRKAWQRDLIEAKVMDLASEQRWPLLEAAVRTEWTDAERAEFDQLSDRACSQSISMRGNTTFTALARQADAIADAVRRRAAAKMVAGAPAPVLMQAAE